MKRVIAGALATSLIAPGLPARASCVSADPTGVFSAVAGDFEMYVDGANVLIGANVADGASSVAVAQIDGVTGDFVPGTLTTVATNFNGQSSVNGPEWVRLPTGALGLAYAGGDGVHSVWRQPAPSAWNDFGYDVYGNPLTSLNGPLMAPTGTGQYPVFELPGISTFMSYQGTCLHSLCASTMGTGAYTDLVVALSSHGLNGSGGALSPRSGYVFASASGGTGASGIYELEIDNSGGIVPGTLQLLAPVASANRNIITNQHPITGTTVVFYQTGASEVSAYEQAAAGGPLALIGRVPVPDPSHLTTKTDPTRIILQFYSGSTSPVAEEISVTANNGALVAGSAKQISTHARGTEISWLPGSNTWALYYRSGNTIVRCPFVP